MALNYLFMKPMQTLRWLGLGLSLGMLCVVQLGAQTPADSLAWVHAPWEIESPAPGLTVRNGSLQLFDTPQQIYELEIDPSLYRLTLVQDRVRRTPGAQGRRSGAQAAINGGFFVTGTRQAIANDFLKIDGQVFPFAGGWGRAGIGITETGELAFLFLPENSLNDTLWHTPYRDVLIAGPMLRFDRQSIPNSDPTRHPRSIIGQKKGGTWCLLVVDGRRRKAAGMSFSELAFIARILGLEYALNLDGGGSSALWLKGKGNLNRPSDRIGFLRFPRPVANAILVLP